MKNSAKTYLGFDLGASSGRAMLGFMDDQAQLTMQEIHHFPNEHLDLDGALYWDFLTLWNQLIDSLKKCAQQGFKKFAGIGIDTWGVDFGILGRDGQFVRDPLCYRDPCTDGMDQVIHAQISPREMYNITGLTVSRVGSLPQLVALKQGPGADRFRIAGAFLMMPDLFRYFLGGRICSERTIAGSSLVYDITQNDWSAKIIKKFGLPAPMFPEIIEPGTITGTLKPEIARRCGVNPAPIIAVAEHDTPSAFAAAPYSDEQTIIISCGTWSVLGQNFPNPLLTDRAFHSGFLNEPGFKSVLFVQNLMGLYLFENLKRELQAQGRKITYAQMIRMARTAQPFAHFLNTNAPLLFAAKQPLALVKEYLQRTRQKPADIESIVRLLLEGLVFSYKSAIDKLQETTGRKYRRICLVGGGIRNTLLCQMTADATGLPVIAGPAEATVTGNFAIQAWATGQLKSADQIREMVKSSFSLKTYKPGETALWDRQYPHYQRMEQKSAQLQ